MGKKILRIATRASALALRQTEQARLASLTAHPQLDVKAPPMTGAGDLNLQKPLHQIGGKGLFVKALGRAPLDGRADLAVHP